LIVNKKGSTDVEPFFNELFFATDDTDFTDFFLSYLKPLRN